MIDFDEFYAMMRKVLGEETVVEAMELKGKASRVQAIFDSVDSNGDGMIDFDEFYAMMRDAASEGRSTSPRKKNSKARKRRASSPSPSPRSPRSLSKSRGKSEPSDGVIGIARSDVDEPLYS